MSTAGEQDAIDKRVRTSQIIVGSLIAGVVVFLVVACLVDLRPNAPVPASAEGGPGATRNPIGSLITYTALGATALLLPLSFVVPGLLAQQNRRAIAAGKWLPPGQGGPPQRPICPEALHSDAGKLALVYHVQLIVGAALNEGVAFFAGIAYLIEKQPLALGLALLLLAGLVVRFPTRHRVALWIDRQQEKLIQERQAAPS
jgi:hypothetical protein